MSSTFHPDLDRHGLLGSGPSETGEGYVCDAERRAHAAYESQSATAKSAAFAAAGPKASHTGLFTTNYGPTGFTLQQKQQIATRQRKKNEGLIRSSG